MGDVGVTKAEASGHVYSLHKLEDFNGNYTAASAGATLGGGGSASTMQNQSGVKINLVSTTQGLKLKLAAEGVKIRSSSSRSLSCVRWWGDDYRHPTSISPSTLRSVPSTPPAPCVPGTC